MKELLIVLFCVFSLALVSCNNEQDGKSGDNIKLSQRDVNFTSASNSVAITTKYGGWWLNEIALNKESVDLTNVDKISNSFTVTNSEFEVKRKDANTILITMNKNSTGTERILKVGIQRRNYYDGIKITQSK
ncbi:hypothetical protein [Flavobacterium chilense]|uniref:BACON domain-containing protein n=1 Tax=Flavobacterium chilense TaxID=946677 RepID=A0A1M7E2K9_9FLAO|nr:hypothetical protein [Flavobacterium chilense]SHL85838.1 hypothetical protein SAMN05444484_102830 [Flavobacterium chilense]